jgi:hypothetical protein
MLCLSQLVFVAGWYVNINVSDILRQVALEFLDGDEAAIRLAEEIIDVFNGVLFS